VVKIVFSSKDSWGLQCWNFEVRAICYYYATVAFAPLYDIALLDLNGLRNHIHMKIAIDLVYIEETTNVINYFDTLCIFRTR